MSTPTTGGESSRSGARIAAATAVVALGLSAGAMLTELLVMVPMWQEMPAAEFLAWFGANEPALVAFFGPLQIASGLLAGAAALFCFLSGRPGTGVLAAATLLVAAALATYALYFRDVNASFAAAAIALEKVPDELARWQVWQAGRTAIGIAAFIVALPALSDDRGRSAGPQTGTARARARA